MNLVFEQILIIFGYVAVGLGAGKLGLVNPEQRKYLTRLCSDLMLPFTILSAASMQVGADGFRSLALALSLIHILRDITKRFGTVLANDRVWLDIYKGEILALLGENGSGKTTLMNMLSGIYFPDEGQIYIDGQEVMIRSPRDAFRYGIGMIHQHFKLVDVLSAAENIVLGLKEPGRLNIDKVAQKVKAICDTCLLYTSRCV